MVQSFVIMIHECNKILIPSLFVFFFVFSSILSLSYIQPSKQSYQSSCINKSINPTHVSYLISPSSNPPYNMGVNCYLICTKINNGMITFSLSSANFLIFFVCFSVKSCWNGKFHLHTWNQWYNKHRVNEIHWPQKVIKDVRKGYLWNGFW